MSRYNDVQGTQEGIAEENLEKKAESKTSYVTYTLRNFIRYRSAEFDQWWNRDLITDKQLQLAGVCELLCQYCSYRFDVWYYKNLFNIKRYDYLFRYCKHKFDKWYDEKDFKRFLYTSEKMDFDFIRDNDINKCYVPQLLIFSEIIRRLNKYYSNQKNIWLNKDKIDFSINEVSKNLIRYCTSDIDLWMDKNRFNYTPNTCLYFCKDLTDHNSILALQNTFRIWWNEDKFDFHEILKDSRTTTSWENMYSSYKSYWEKKLMLEKLRRE